MQNLPSVITLGQIRSVHPAFYRSLEDPKSSKGKIKSSSRGGKGHMEENLEIRNVVLESHCHRDGRALHKKKYDSPRRGTPHH